MAGENEGKLAGLKTVVLAALFIIVFLAIFSRLSDKAGEKRTEGVASEIQLLMEYDMFGEYPNTPRDVAKMHNRYFKAFYGTGVTDEELVVMNQKIRQMYSSELLQYNTEDTNLKKLKENINAVNEAGYEYRTYELPEASQVVYYTQDDKEMATMEVKITFNVEEGMEYMYLKYIMVKEKQQWKIHVWGISDTIEQKE